jgi:cytochrome c peroxidase
MLGGSWSVGRLVVVGLLLVNACSEPTASGPGWSESELALLRSLTLSSLGDPPEPVSNEFAADPRAARLGQRLFFDPALSRDGSVACVSCHLPAHYFTDGKAVSEGLGRGTRNAPTLVGAAYSPWQFWDGRRDSLWAQALAPLEAEREMGSDRLWIVRYVTGNARYRDVYSSIFGDPPNFANTVSFPERAGPFGDPAAREAWARLSQDQRHQVNRAFSNVGKAIAAYGRLLVPAPARFDRYVEALLAGDLEGAAGWLDADEIAGLRLFLDAGRTQCLRCHNGPLFTNQSFHDVATSRLGPLPDLGRFVGIHSLRLDPFNCLGPYSDAPREACQELRFLATQEIALETGAFKTPTLRDVARTSPYFHDGSVADLFGVLNHYQDPPEDPSSELVALDLEEHERAELIAFLGALSGGVAELPEGFSVGPGSKNDTEMP